tara:strand:- start:158 stop:307 length:150 start_codon:yes stop_codon:yes gene_type:complete
VVISQQVLVGVVLAEVVLEVSEYLQVEQELHQAEEMVALHTQAQYLVLL